MPFGVRNSLDDILRRMGVGSYETAGGEKISKEMLPPNVQQAVDAWGNVRDSSNMSGDMFKKQEDEQAIINKLYDPATRDAMMRQSMTPEGKRVGGYATGPGQIMQDFDQEQGMNTMLDEITNALAKRKVRATRGR